MKTLPHTIGKTPTPIVSEREIRQAEFNKWVREVRDPAPYRSEGPRIIEIGSCSLEYELSPLPDGRFAGRCDCRGGGGCSHGWIAYESREAALADILSSARHFFGRKDVVGAKMLARLDSTTLFGFEEPEPLPRSEWWDDMIAQQIGWLTLHQSWDLIGVIRGTDCKPMSKSGSWFDIPLPDGVKGKGRYAGAGDVIDEEDEAMPTDDEE